MNAKNKISPHPSDNFNSNVYIVHWPLFSQICVYWNLGDKLLKVFCKHVDPFNHAFVIIHNHIYILHLYVFYSISF